MDGMIPVIGMVLHTTMVTTHVMATVPPATSVAIMAVRALAWQPTVTVVTARRQQLLVAAVSPRAALAVEAQPQPVAVAISARAAQAVVVVARPQPVAVATWAHAAPVA